MVYLNVSVQLHEQPVDMRLRSRGQSSAPSNIGALIITNTILGVRYYMYSIMGPKPYSNY